MLKIVFVALQIGLIAATIVDPELYNSVKSSGSADIILEFSKPTSQVLKKFENTRFVNNVEKNAILRKELISFTQEEQRGVLSFLQTKESKGKVQSFWITNKVSVKGANLALIEHLAENFPSISLIRAAKVFPLEKAIESPVSTQEIAWGVERVRAPDAWFAGYNGSGIVVANIDSGVRWNHVSLIENYRGGDYGWYDPYDFTDIPKDFNGHGTHTMGSIVGSFGIGVAPGAKWIACKGCGSAACGEVELLGCGEWVACPTKFDKTEPDCSQAPKISSNSWGGGQGDSFYNDVVDYWRNVGILPIFAIGNSGPFCETANSPGDQLNLISVGATDIQNNVAVFSSHGPGVEDINRVKPEISAPGVNIKSASNFNPEGYTQLSGTSMACPHVAGAAAVLLSKNPDASFDGIIDALYASTVQPPIESTPCGNVTDPKYPNNSYGWGILDLRTALDAMTKS